MASFCGRDLRNGTDDIADYNRYCFFVAGLVGVSRYYSFSFAYVDFRLYC